MTWETYAKSGGWHENDPYEAPLRCDAIIPFSAGCLFSIL